MYTILAIFPDNDLVQLLGVTPKPDTYVVDNLGIDIKTKKTEKDEPEVVELCPNGGCEKCTPRESTWQESYYNGISSAFMAYHSGCITYKTSSEFISKYEKKIKKSLTKSNYPKIVAIPVGTYFDALDFSANWSTQYIII